MDEKICLPHELVSVQQNKLFPEIIAVFAVFKMAVEYVELMQECLAKWARNDLA